MNLTRRKFFAGLAVAPLVIVAVAKALPVLADTTFRIGLPPVSARAIYNMPDTRQMILARWTKDKILPTIYGRIRRNHG